MDPQSLDVAVQNTLSGLYPPFDITAPTVLSQLFRVLEAKYHGDGLCCLLDFLIPSKRLLEHVRQAACAPYISCVFLHEGWPLCLHEKVVVHLGPLNPLLLRPGDFYLQAEPCGEQSACLVVKCLSRDLTTVEKIPVPESSCSLLFTKEWLEEINQGFDRPTLHTCLVATGNGIVPVPWNKIATPEFVNIPKTEGSVEQEASDCPETHWRGNSQHQEDGNVAGDEHSRTDRSLRPTQGKFPGLIKVEQGSWKKSTLFVVPSLCDIISENLEGEYVNLLGFSGEGKLDESSPAKAAASATEQQPQREAPPPEARKGLLWVEGDNEATVGVWSCGKGQNPEEGPCTPCLKRRLNKDPKVHELRCRYRESYVAALKNPVSFSSGLMAAIMEEIDASKQSSPSESTDVLPPEGPDQAAPRVLSEHPYKDRKAEEGSSKPGHFKPLKPPADCPAASSKFSFLKGHRQLGSLGGSLSMSEKAGKGQEGPQKRTSVVCSPRTARAKAVPGKGTSQGDMLSELPAPKNIESITTSTSGTDALVKVSLPLGSGPQELVHWELLSPELLSSGIVCLPGNADKLGRPIVQICTSGTAWQAPWCSARKVARLLLYFRTMSRKQLNDAGLTIVIDARKETPSPALSAALGSVQRTSPGCIHAVLLLAEKEAASHLEKVPGLQMELLGSLKALGRHVDGSQLTEALDGQFAYCHSEWVQYFQKVHQFLSDLRKASDLLQSTTQELEKGEVLENLQEVEQQVDRHRQLMQEVLCNAQLVSLQREGGATLARLRKEAARLSFSPDVRNSIGHALALYNLVEEEVHTLVTKSNSRLEHLEFLLKIRELEAEFSKVHYNRGLSLSKEASKVQGSTFPEMGAFEAAKRAFQAKLTTFYMDMEMKGAELETLLDLYRFYDKATQFKLDCKQRLDTWSHRENEMRSTEVQQDLERSLQQLAREFSAEKFQQMKMHASSMSSKQGLAVWNEALERCQEAKQLLEDTLARFREALEGGAKDSEPNPAPIAIGEDCCVDGAAAKSKEQEVQLECHRRNEAGSVDRTSVYDGPSQEDPLSREISKDGKGSEEGYLDSLDVILECGGPEAKDLDEQAPESCHTTLPACATSPHAKKVPGARDGLPSPKQPCLSMPTRGQRSRTRETAQYFQLSRHGSFSSEDADSQSSTEDTLGSTATLPMEPSGPKGAWTQEKALGIIYLENHSTNSPANAATQ
ncbi:uncharacterized protein KIAA1755 homolog isoform X2 [Rhineura floridana]|uniref:uncharacterized protein KIAA1755 homolog isoform X2 n=1 Tax=Rhineura floridana TaxID=261503 RepID=UPI002AC88135|nr:uncharacterized protein KIAA1755 homolog isoform X2 [Rhineura floridana]